MNIEAIIVILYHCHKKHFTLALVFTPRVFSTFGGNLVRRASRPRATFIGPGIDGTGSARKLSVVSKAHTLELGHFSTRNNFHREVLRRNEICVLTYFDRKIFPSEKCSTSGK